MSGLKNIMVISEKKTKAMIFNWRDNYQFTTQLHLKGENIEIVDKMKILGTIITNKLSWNDNCALIIKKVNARMQLLRGVHGFGANINEMVHLWTVYCRSVLEQSCVVWGSTLTLENTNDLERTQKSFLKMILKDKYVNYENALFITNLDSLEQRRKHLILTFAKSGIKYDKFNDLITRNEKVHTMKNRNTEHYKVHHANTARFGKSSILTMQNELNKDLSNKRNIG